jgi:predicted ThiF/HesA family dinucleotide-utilizing enzyme
MKSFLRQTDIFVPNGESVTIIGAGGIGSWVTLGLVKTGFEHIEVWDGDITEEHNVPNQYFTKIGVNKAEELASSLPPVKAVSSMWDGEPLNSDIIVIGVDNMDVRKRIVETQHASLIIDGRIGGELIRVLSVSMADYGSREYFLKTWYPSSDAVELPCTARAIADVGFFVGGLICNLIRKFIKDGAVTREIIFDAGRMEMLKIQKEA